VAVLAPGGRAANTEEVVQHADTIVLAVPTHPIPRSPGRPLRRQDPCRRHELRQPVDGVDAELTSAAGGTSAVVQEHFASARVVKSLNQLSYHQLEENLRAKGALNRITLGAAGDDREAVRKVMRLVDRLGFDPVDAGAPKNGVVLEPDGSPVATTYGAVELSERVSGRATGDE